MADRRSSIEAASEPDFPIRLRPAPPISRVALAETWPNPPDEFRDIDGLIATVRYLRATLREVQHRFEWSRNDRDVLLKKYKHVRGLYSSLHVEHRELVTAVQVYIKYKDDPDPDTQAWLRAIMERLRQHLGEAGDGR